MTSALRKIYCYDTEKFKSLFNEDYQLGSIIKFKFDNFAVTFIVQPSSDHNRITDFNFHCQLEGSKNISKCIEKYKEAKEYSKNTLEGFFR